MVLTQLPTAQPDNDKLFTYQVYSGITNTVTNMIHDGNFSLQGSEIDAWLDNNSSVQWLSTSGSHTYNFSKVVTKDQTAGQAAVFNGQDAYIAVTNDLSTENFLANNTKEYGYANVLRYFAMSVYRSTWNTTALEVLYWGAWCYLAINQTPGYLSFFVRSADGKLYETKTPLSGLSAGWHKICFGIDGQFMDLNVDNSIIVSNAFTGNPQMDFIYGILGTLGTPLLGCGGVNYAGQNLTTQQTYAYFFTGMIDDFASWMNVNHGVFNTYIVPLYNNNSEAYAWQQDIGITYVLLNGLDHHFTFDNDTTSLCVDIVQGVTATPTNVTYTAGTTYTGRSLFVPLNNPGATPVGFEGNPALASQLNTLVSGTTYNVALEVLGQNIGGTGVITIKFTDGTHSWSSNISSSQLTNQWQRFIFSFQPQQYGLSNNVYARVEITGNITGTVYFDHFMLSPTFLPGYFDNTVQDSTVRNVYVTAGYDYVGTQYTFTYLKNWTDVGSLPPFSQEVGTLGSQITLQLNRDPNNCGEGYDLRLNNRVFIQYASQNSPSGLAYFDGYIADYTLDYDNNSVSVILISYGNNLQNYLLLSGTAPAAGQPLGQNLYVPYVDSGFCYGLVQQFTTAPGQTTLAGIGVWVAFISPAFALPNNLTVAVFNTLSQAATAVPQLGAALGYGQVYPPSANNGTYPTGLTQIYIPLNETISVEPNTTYFFNISVPASNPIQIYYGSSTSIYPSPTYELTSFSQTGSTLGTDGISYYTPIAPTGLQFQTYSENSGSNPLYPKTDPGFILQSIVNNARLQGANINFTPSSIDMTGQPVTYQFQTSLCSDAIGTIPTLCPPGWFTYIDQSSNTVHLHAYSSRIVHKLLLGNHIQKLKFEKRMDTMCNSVYLTGGQDTANPGFNVFRFYQHAGSVAQYGVRLQLVSDNRVSDSATADIVAQSYINPNPEIRTTITISDKVYNIDSFREGDMINFGNFRNGKTTNWDQVTWGISSTSTPEGYWDFDITSPETLYLYIERMDYNIDSVSLTLSTTPPEVNKKLQKTLNALIKQQTLANPPTPTEGLLQV